MKQQSILVFIIAFLLLIGCQPDLGCTNCADDVVPTLVVVAQNPPPLANLPHSPTLPATITAVSTTTPISTATIQTKTPQPTATMPPLSTPTTSTPIFCQERTPTHNLFAIVTKTYGLSSQFEPFDLVPIADYFPHEVTLGYPTEIRDIVTEPLYTLISDMKLAGLRPQILSGYRSYISQSIAYDKWARKQPDRVDILSARPGHSEHQLGTTIDFGSPELVDIVGPGFQFHTYFYQTSEGIWLAENAHKYGFTLSYPREAAELTGFTYEPWHYRYVGVERASWLKSQNSTLTEQQLNEFAPPCIPND